MNMAPVAIVTPASEKFWGKFAEEHIATISALNIKPEQVIVVSDADITLPKGWTLVQAPELIGAYGSVQRSINKGFQQATTDWVMYKPVDDLMDSNFFDGMKYEGDVINVSGRWAGGFCYGTPEGFANLLHLDHNGMPGWMVIRREVAYQIPFRPVYFDDWVFWLDVRASGRPVSFDGRCVFTWRTHEDSFSFGSAGIPDEAMEQIRLLRQMHLAGRVRFAAEWPPVFE